MHFLFSLITVTVIPSGHLVPKLRRINVDATSSRRIDVNTTSFIRHVSAGILFYLTFQLAFTLNKIIWRCRPINSPKNIESDGVLHQTYLFMTYNK